jgi:hypothetical protein
MTSFEKGSSFSFKGGNAYRTKSEKLKAKTLFTIHFSLFTKKAFPPS